MNTSDSYSVMINNNLCNLPARALQWPAGLCKSTAKNMKKFLFIKIFLTLIVALSLTACKKVHQQLPQPNTGRMLQIELKMPEAWKKIVIGPAHSTEYPNIPQRFSMFVTGELSGALKPYLLIEDSTGREYSILIITITRAYKGQTET